MKLHKTSVVFVMLGLTIFSYFLSYCVENCYYYFWDKLKNSVLV